MANDPMSPFGKADTAIERNIGTRLAAFHGATYRWVEQPARRTRVLVSPRSASPNLLMRRRQCWRGGRIQARAGRR